MYVTCDIETRTVFYFLFCRVGLDHSSQWVIECFYSWDFLSSLSHSLAYKHPPPQDPTHFVFFLYLSPSMCLWAPLSSLFSLPHITVLFLFYNLLLSWFFKNWKISGLNGFLLLELLFNNWSNIFILFYFDFKFHFWILFVFSILPQGLYRLSKEFNKKHLKK